MITSVGNLAGPAVGLITAPLLAISLGVEGRGELAAATAPLILASNAVTLGLPDALTYHIARRSGSKRRLIITSLLILGILGVVASGFIVVLSPFLAKGSFELAELISLAGLGVAPALIMAGLRALAVGQQRWGLVTAEKYVGSLSRLAAFLISWSSGVLDLRVATVLMAVTTFCGLVVYLGLLWGRRGETGHSPSLVASPSRAIVSYGLRIWAGSLSGILLVRLSQTIMLPLSDAYELGLFVVAVTLSEAALVFNSAVATVTFAQQSVENDNERLATAARTSTAVTALLSVVIGSLGIWALPVFFGPDFQAAWPALAILLVAAVAGNPGSVAGQGLNARGRPELRSVSLLIALAFNVLAMIYLVPLLGSVGAALAQLVGNVAAAYMNLTWLKWKFGVPISTFLMPRWNDLARVWPRRKNEGR